MTKKYILIIFSFFLALQMNAQSKKILAKYGVKSVVETVSEDGKTVNDSKKIFNKDGEVIEEVSYDKSGALKDITKNIFDKHGNCIEQLVLKDGKVVERKTIKYDANDDKIEELLCADNKSLAALFEADAPCIRRISPVESLVIIPLFVPATRLICPVVFNLPFTVTARPPVSEIDSVSG